MEKFTVYADKTTGIMPFREIPLKVSFLQYIVSVVVLPVKILLLIVLTLVSPILRVVAPQTLARTASYLLGVGATEFVVDGVRRSDTKGIKNASLVAGDIVVVNANGPLDYFVWKAIAQCPSLICIALENGEVAALGFKDWIDWCFSGSASFHGHTTTLAALPQDRIIFVVAEGTVTNGKSIVRFPPGFTLNDTKRVKTLSTRATPITCTTVGPTNKLSWAIVNLGSITPPARYRMKLSILKEGASDNEIRNVLADMGKMKVVGDGLTVQTKREYLSALEELKSKNKKRV